MSAPERPAWLRLPSLGAAIQGAGATLWRFPLVIACAVAAATASILMGEDLGPPWLHGRLLAAASLGLPLFTAITIFGERLRALAARAAVALGGLAVLAAVYVSWERWAEPVQLARYIQLSAAFHLLVAFLPFVRRRRPTAFWQYNRLLLQRFVLAGVSSGTLFLGLALALAALNKLFGVDLPRLAYFRVWMLCGFVFNTWFFLGGVPRDLDALEQSSDYPVVLRVFAQYTLVPLVVVYLVMLTLYFGKVVVSWDWPSGWIGYLVSGVATAGILALLLVHPLAERTDQRWVATFARDFWLGMLPAVVMLWLAVYQRVHQYGFTEPRYFLLVLSLWLGAAAAYFGVTRSRKIQVIPASLGVLALATIAGPWGAFAVARRSQVDRVREVLTAGGVLAGGHVRRAAADLGPAERRALSGAVRYLVATHGSRSLTPLLGDSFTARVIVPADRASTSPDDRARAIVAALGVSYVAKEESPGAAGTWFAYTAEDEAVPIAGYDLLLAIRRVPPAAGRDGRPAAVLVRAARSVRVLRSGTVLLDLPLDSVLRRARAATAARPATAASTLPAALFRVEGSASGIRGVVQLRSISGYETPGGPDIRNVDGVVLLKMTGR